MEALKHPDIFTPAEAVEYLHLDGPDQLETVRREYGLVGFRPVGKGFLYWREDLDKAAERMFGRAKQEPAQLRLAGRRA